MLVGYGFLPPNWLSTLILCSVQGTACLADPESVLINHTFCLSHTGRLGPAHQLLWRCLCRCLQSGGHRCVCVMGNRARCCWGPRLAMRSQPAYLGGEKKKSSATLLQLEESSYCLLVSRDIYMDFVGNPKQYLIICIIKAKGVSH